jgi:glycosyltransferase involved in cell wall biosynthesis
MTDLQISIILCFYNAGDKLIPTIEHIAKLETTNISGIEIIFVDNNSKDNSCKIIQDQLIGFTKFPWKIVSEPSPGLSNARIRGIKESTYDILLFCDDDNWLASDYLQKGLEILKKDSIIAILGGCGTAISKTGLPYWFDNIKIYYACGEQIKGGESGKCLVLYGAGMFIRKQAFLEIASNGFHFYNLGRTGTKLTSGEDSELCLAFQIAGYKIWYDRSLTFFHFIEPKRLTLPYLKKIKNGIGTSFIIRFYLDYFNGYVPKITRWFWLKEFLYSFKDGCFALLKIKRNFAERSFKFCWYLIKERSRYNRNAQNILQICESLNKLNLQKK